MAEMNAAKNALDECSHLFPHLSYQKRILERSFKQQGFDFVRLDFIRGSTFSDLFFLFVRFLVRQTGSFLLDLKCS